ncbi:TauD/TfdA family dioxygenase [Coleofasciculus sp.]|uniref:TauD/TfdA family dioxygenase n=1 Tax=Coleofasciculus sp. TaxID=3100458 RepID=UPI0039F7BC32
MSEIASSLKYHQTPLKVNKASLQCLDLSWSGFSEEFTQVMGNCDWRIEPEVFITKAHWLVHKQMTVEVLRTIEEFCFAPNAPSALLFKNLPIDNLLPLTPKSAETSAGECPISEGLILGIARCFGQPFNYSQNKERGGLINDTVPTEKAYTMLCDARTLCNALEPLDIELLRLHPIERRDANTEGFFSKPAITGTVENPCVDLIYEDIRRSRGITASSPIEEVQAAYERLGEKAAELATGVFLTQGDLLIINNNRTLHGRKPFTPRFDGSDRWLKKTFVSFNLWNSGKCQWPSREMPYLQIVK